MKRTTGPITPPYPKVHLWDGGAYSSLGLESLHNHIKGEKGLTFQPKVMRLANRAPMRRRKAFGSLESLFAFLQAELACTRQSQLMNCKADVMRRCLCPDLRQE